MTAGAGPKIAWPAKVALSSRLVMVARTMHRRRNGRHATGGGGWQRSRSDGGALCCCDRSSSELAGGRERDLLQASRTQTRPTCPSRPELPCPGRRSLGSRPRRPQVPPQVRIEGHGDDQRDAVGDLRAGARHDPAGRLLGARVRGPDRRPRFRGRGDATTTRADRGASSTIWMRDERAAMRDRQNRSATCTRELPAPRGARSSPQPRARPRRRSGSVQGAQPAGRRPGSSRRW